MKLLKQKTFWIMLFVVLVGTALRLIFINKPDGLWNDEYISWAIASIPIGKKFFHEMMSQCHMPLYYFYLKIFISTFGNSDLVLRLTSVLAGIFSIIAMYFVGKEYKDEKLGILCATVTALSSFLIYFSQEVRFYQLLFLFSGLSLFYTLKLGKEPTKGNLIGYITTNFLIIITHTIGFIFVIFNAIFLSIWLAKTDEKLKINIKKAWLIFGIIGLTFIPVMTKMCCSHPYSQWWTGLNAAKFGFLFTDYFSPILTNIVSAPENFFYNFSIKFIIWGLLPTGIALAGLFNALRTKKIEILGLMSVSSGFILALALFAYLGKLVFISKYLMEIYPILIMVMSFGLLEFKKEWGSKLIFIYCAISLLFIVASPNSAPKAHRSEGHKIVAELLKNAELKKDDIILLNYYPQNRFEKYFNFNNYRVKSINKGNFENYIKVSPEFNTEKIDNKYFDDKFKAEFLDALKPSQKIAIVTLNDVAIYSPVQIKEISKDESTYKQTAFLFYVFSYLRNESLKECLNNLQILRIEEKGSWTATTFQKQ